MSEMTDPRMVSQGYLLYEYLPDDKKYVLVGVIDSALGGHGIVDGIATDDKEAQEFIDSGKVDFQVMEVGNG